MSDSILRFVPADPFWQPTPDDAEKAAGILRSIAPDADAIEPVFEESVIFYDPGGNWSGVECSACGADAEAWWGDAMDAAYASEFASLEVKAACCGNVVSLNNLRYVWPAAFGRFALTVQNPDIADTTDEQDRQLSQCLGSPLRKIWVRI